MTMNNLFANPAMQMLDAMRRGQSPRQVLMGMARSNPQMGQIMQLMQNRSPEQLRQIASNMAAERGTTVENVARQLGIQIPSNQ